MKNKAIITSLIIIMVGIIALGIGWHKIFDASATKPNLIECKGHIDKNQDMSCDICGAILSGESDTKYKTVKNTLESGTTIEVKGDMPSNAVLTTKEITKEVATNIAKRYIPLDDDKVLYAYDISMVLKNKKYQPENYGKDVNITLTNLGIEDQKDVVVMHILDDKSYEIMKLDELTKNKVSFKTTSFSTYIVLKVATYNVTFTGTGNFEVQTIRGNKITNSTELVSGTNFTFVVTPKAGYGISGITTSNGTITTNGDVLRKTAIIDNITQATTITVTTVAAPVVTKQPVTVKVNSGETAIYTVTAQNATTYEWQYRTNENDYWKSASEIGTASNGTLTISNVTDAISGYSIRCMLSNDSFDNGYEVKTDMAYVILTEGTLQMPVAIDEPIKEESKMITEWTIPAANTTIKLPVQGTGLNVTVDWGDGTAEETFTTSFPTHTYATAGIYEIKVWGTCPKWGYASVNTVSSTSNSDYYTYTQYLTKVKQFGELGAQQYGFAQCKNLTEVSGDNLVTNRTFEKTTSMAYMFSGCGKLISLDVSKFDTSKVTNMFNMFSYCKGLTSLDLSKFDTSKVTNMFNMFGYCNGLTSLDVSNFDTSNVTYMGSMFSNCSSLTSLDLSNFNTSNVTEMSGMFSDCSSLTSLDLSNFNTSNVTKMSSMFSDCSSLTSLDLSNFNTSKVTNMSWMFGNCSNLTSLDVSNFDTSNVTNMGCMFYECSNLVSLDVSNFDTSNVTRMYSLFAGCASLTSLDVSNFDTSNVTDMGSMFSGCSSLTGLNVSNFDTSNVTDMGFMFSGCSALKNLDVSNFNTSKVTDMGVMFQHCSTLKNLNLNNFDTSKVKDMSSMFCGCSSLITLDLSNFDTLNVTEMDRMFWNCSSLISLNLSNFDTSNVVGNFNNGMEYMFSGCLKLTSLDLSNFDTSKIANMKEMFKDCTNLKSLQLSDKFKIPTSNTTNMLTNTTNLTSIILVDSTPLAGQFTSIKAQLDGKTFYVPSKVAETAYETSWSADFSGDRIQPILELVGKENITINLGSTYTDAGYTVAGFDTANSGDYTVYGYNVTTSGEVNTAVAGTYKIDYTITRTYNNAGTTQTDTLMTVTRNITVKEVIKEESKMITEWNVSGDAGLTIKLPAQSYGGTSLNITVDWGDGTATETFTTAFPTHTYATAGTYEIKVWGTCPMWGYASSSYVSATSNSDYYTYTQYLTKVKQFGELNVTQYGFAQCKNLKEVSGENLVTSKTFEKTTSMASMFYNCRNLTSLDVSGFDTSKVTNMRFMFSDCSNLTSLDVSGFDTSKVTNMRFMFYFCSNLTSLDLSGFDTSKVTDMSDMFYYCRNLTSLDVSGFDTSNVTNMSWMFSNCSKLTSLDLSGFNTSKVTNMERMFYKCSNLTSLDLSGFDTSKVTTMSYMFSDCSNLTSLDVSGFDTSNVTDMLAMFYYCRNLTSLDVSKFNTSKVTYMSSMFSNCSNLTSLDVSKFDTSNVTHMSIMFYSCSKLMSLDVSNFNTSNVITMESMFYECSNLVSLDVSNFDTSNVTNMSWMFSYCRNLTSLDVSNFNTSKVTDMGVMFQHCSTLKNLNVSNFDTSNVTNMSWMFSNCSNLTSLDVSNFDTSKVTEMDRMFGNCSSLISLNLSNFDTSKIANMKEMFKGCTNLKTLQLSNKFVIPASNNTNMFTNTTNLKSIILVDTTPLAGQFTNIKAQLDGKTFYVPSKVAETAYETSWAADFTADRIHPILELVGDENVTIDVGSTYTDAGYTVAGLTTADAQYYTPYGYKVTKTGEVVTSTAGVYPVKYEITRTYNNAGTTQTDTLMSVTRNVTVGSGIPATSMVTEWTIPADNTEIKLPVQGTGLNITVDWGDGSAEQTVTTAFPTHTYATAGTYEIIVSGTCPVWGYASSDAVSETSNSDYYTYTQYLTKVKQFGELGAQQYGFAFCKNLTEVSGENLVTSKTFEKTTSMANMFRGCSNLTSLDVSNFDTSKVTNMRSMFSICSSLTSLDVSNLDTSNVTRMTLMFYNCSSLTKLDLSNFDTSKVTDMSYMFSNCSSLTDLDVSNFDTSKVTNMSWMFSSCEKLINFDISGFNTSNVTDMHGMFSNCWSLTSLDVSKFDTSKVTNMSYMFSRCGLISLDISNFNTFKVTDMSYMFGARSVNNEVSSGIKEIKGLENINTSNVISMMGMFQCCAELEYIDVSNFDTSKVTNMSWMFDGCLRLTTLDVSKFDTSKVTDMSMMFYACGRLTNLDVNNFNTSKVTNMKTMFGSCYSLKTLQLSNKFVIPASNNTNMFTSTTNLTSIILVDSTPLAGQFTNVKAQLDGKTFYVPSKSAETAYETSWAADFTADRIHPILELIGDENVTIDVGATYTDAGYTVAGLTTADAQYYTPYGYNVTKTGEVVTSTVGVYQIKYEITRTYTSGGTTKTDTLMNVTRNITVKGAVATSMITEWTIPSANTTIKLPVQSHGGNSLNITVDWGDGSAVQIVTTNFPTHTYTTAGTYDITVSGTCPAWGYMGSGRVSTTLNSDYYTYTQYLTKVKQFGELNAQYYGFSQCTNLTSVKGATKNSTSNVTTMANMFYFCQRLTELDLTNFDTLKVTDMNYMFFKVRAQEIDLSSFNTSNVTNMSYMFGECGFLTNINLSGFNTSKVTNMSAMFKGCDVLTKLDLSKFKTSKVAYMNEMFSNCTSLKSLKVSDLNFNTVNVINMKRMFYNCSSLTEIPVAKFNTSNVTNFDEMFARCSSLKTLNLSNFVVSNYFEGNDSNSMLNGCTSLRSIQISSTFRVPMSKMFLNTPNLTAIIVLGNTPSAEQFSPCLEDLEGKTFYVTDEEFLEIYRKAWAEGFSEDRIKPLLELKGSSPITITKGTNYVDAGYTIAGFTEEDEIYYSVYGYSATVKSTVDSSVIGSYSVTYTLKCKDSSSGLGMVEILMNVVRIVVVEEGNIVGLDIIPPTGSITVKDATIRNNINYVPSNNVTLEISAQDNISTSSEIKVYITTEAIDLTKTIADALWENYSNGMTKSITITNLSATTRIYALFKDAAGNTSAAFTGADTEYSIIYNLNGGTGSIENGTANYGSPAILSNKVPTKSGMYFLGWSTNASATVASYKAGGVMQADTFSGTNKNINLYAVWGNKPLISEVVEIGDLIDLPIYYNDLSGNNRTDWKVISKVENSTTGRSSVVVISTGIPLTLANTSADLVNDFFNMNNYSENGFENNIELSELFLNKYVDVSDEKPNVKGTKNGNNVYVLITLKDLTLTAGKNAYNKWSAEKQLDKITVSFNANGGTLTEVSKDVVYAGKYGTLPTPTREGYQFNGWYTRSVDGTLVKDTTKVTKNYNHTLYAHWTSIGYTFVLSFDSNGGTGTMTTQSYTEGKAKAIKANTFTKAGYTFAGWATSANGGVVYADKASIILTENTTLYAVWNKLTTPSNFWINSYGKTSASLGDIWASWDDVEGATSYTIAYSTDNSTWTEKTESASLSTPIKNGYWPQTNGHYYVKVKADVNGGSSDWSEVREIKYEYIRLGVSDGSTQLKEVRLLLVGGYTIFLKEKTSDTISISAYYGGGVPGNNHTDEILEDEYIQGRSWYTNDSTPSQVKPVVIELYAGEAGTWKESSSGSTTGYYTTPYTIVLYGSSTLQDRIEYVPMY